MGHCRTRKFLSLTRQFYLNCQGAAKKVNNKKLLEPNNSNLTRDLLKKQYNSINNKGINDKKVREIE